MRPRVSWNLAGFGVSSSCHDHFGAGQTGSFGLSSDRSTMNQPARGYSWTTFQPGNVAPLWHGAWSPRRVEPLAAELVEHVVSGVRGSRPALCIRERNALFGHPTIACELSPTKCENTDPRAKYWEQRSQRVVASDAARPHHGDAVNLRFLHGPVSRLSPTAGRAEAHRTRGPFLPRQRSG